MADKRIKYVIFIAIIIFMLAVAGSFLAFSDVIVSNWPWFLLLIIFLYVVTQYDVLLQLVDFQRAVIYRFGKVNRVGGPGWTFIIPFIETPTIVDLRTKTIDVPKQDIITKDGIELKVDGVIYIKIKKDRQSVVNSVIEVEDYREASRLYVISSIRDIMGSMDLSDIISNIEVINAQIKESLERISKEWGVSVDSVEIKDVDIPKTVLDAMHEEKAAVQQKLARMEKALAHKAEIQAVKEAAAGLDQKALTYYYIKAIEGMSKSKGSQVFFPAEFSKLAGAFATSREAKPVLKKVNEEYKDVLKDYIDKSVAKAKGEKPKKKSTKKKTTKKKTKKKNK
jgi:regulator of protease activity HflC (stomatin/prohibitin superfamily)